MLFRSGGCGEKGTLEHSLWECKLVQRLQKTVWRFLKKLKIKLPYDPAIPLLGIYPDKTLIQKDTCIPIFTAVLFTIAETWKQPKCPLTDEWIKKMWSLHCGSLRVCEPFTWFLVAPRASIPRQAGGRYMTISGRALEIMQHPLCCIPLVKRESLKVNLHLKKGT